MTSILRDRLDQLPTERRQQFLALLKSGRGERAPAGPIRRPALDSAPLSGPQLTLAMLNGTPGALAADNAVVRIWLRGELDAGALERALTELVNRHATLRTSLPDEGAGPVQRVAVTPQVQLPVTSVAQGGAVQAAAELAASAFDLQRGPLWRAALLREAGSADHLFVFAASRLVFDRGSAAVLLDDLARLYRAGVAGTAPQLPGLPVNYRDFTHWHKGAISPGGRRAITEYWRQHLQSPPVADLPADRPRQAEPGLDTGFAQRALEPEAAGAVQALAVELQVPTSTIYLSALFELARRYCRQSDLLVAVSGTTRARPELSPLIGWFEDWLMLRVDLGGSATFEDIVRRVQLVRDGAQANRGLGLHEVTRALSSAGDPSIPQIARIAFSTPEPVPVPELPGLCTELDVPAGPHAYFDLTVSVTEDGERPCLAAGYRRDLFDEATVADLLAHYATLTAALAGDPRGPVAQALMLSPQERREQLGGSDGAYRSYPPATIHGWFAHQAARTPEAIALVAGDERVTYRELAERAGALAAALRAHGARRERIVAVCLPRGTGYVTAALGALMAGAGFLPLDPSHPTSRLLDLLGDASPACLLTTPELAGALHSEQWAALTPEDLRPGGSAGSPDGAGSPNGAGEGPADGASTPSDLAYVLYTSGSTGTPKGVLVEHGAVVNFIEAMRDLFVLGPADRMLGYASVTYDVSIFEMFGALLTGGTLCLALDNDRLDLERLQQLLEREEITVTDLPPSVMALLEPERLTKLRIVFVGGEAFPGELVNRWNQGRRLFNGYGPTECTVTMIVHECPGVWNSSPPIGLPIANHVAYVLDDNLEAVPYGVPGELYIGGLGLARGYLNEPELTRQRFIHDPVGGVPGGRLYRTGDLVKRRRDGALTFLGRIDRQLKIRGMRIEPAEIETALASHPDVRQAFSDVWVDKQGEPHLVGYVGLVAGAEADPQALRAHLATLLPAVVVPDRIVVVPELPLGASGKVDRAALPAPQTATAPAARAALTETERILADEVFGATLGVASVDTDADFFALGGSSLQAAQAVFGIRRRFGVEVSVADFFRDPTVAGLAAVVDRQRVVELDDDGLLDALEQMTDEEVERILRAKRVEEVG